MNVFSALEEYLKQSLVDVEGVQLVYLFGSRVKGNLGPMSDYDFGVVIAHGCEDEDIIANLRLGLQSFLKTGRVDVVILNHAPIEFVYTVIAEGICLYQKDLLTRVEFEANSFSRYGDFLPVLRAQKKDILNREGYERRVQRYREAFRRTERTIGEIRTNPGKTES